MKIYLLLIASLFAIQTDAQNSNNPKYDEEHQLNVHDSWGRDDISNFNKSPNLTFISKNLSKKLEANEPINDSIVYYDYTNKAPKDSVRYSKWYYNYDDKGNLILENYYRWEEDKWSHKSTYNSEYNSRNNRVLYNKYNWDSDSNSWKLVFETTFEYDKNNNLISGEEHRTNDSNKLLPDNRVEYLFDKYNVKLSGQRLDWDKSYQKWTNDYYFDYHYDDKGNLIGRSHYHLNGTDKDYYFKTVREYDSNNNEILLKKFRLRNSKLELDDKYISTYNNDNIIISYEKHHLNSSLVWEAKWIEQYTSSQSGLLFYTLNSLWKVNEKKWDIYYSTIYYYKDTQLSNKALDIDSYSIYPNPIETSGKLTIQSKGDNEFQYSIFNTNGMLVLRGTSKTKQKTIDVSSLAKGVYFINISNSEGSLSKKIIR